MDPFEKKGMEEKGLAHVWAAFGYSMDGLKVLMREEAARLEVAMLVVAAVIFAFLPTGLAHYGVLVALFLFVLLVEALNTAVELIIDRTSPEISDYAKQAKDLGSFAVFCALALFNGYVLVTVLSLTMF